MSSREVTIASWNMWCFNEHLDEAFSFIQNLECDVLCLQEVPEAFLARLRTLPFHLAESVDSAWYEQEGKTWRETRRYYLVILSKHPISAHRSYAVMERPPRAVRTSIFQFVMHYLGHWSRGVARDRTILSADLAFGTQTMRLFSLHLDLVTPALRQKQFEQVRKHLYPTYANIICGDFNILDSWRMKPLNWFLGGPLAQALPWYDERGRIEKSFADAGLKNTLRGLITHRVAHSQLDHILVPASAQVIDRRVIRETHGSDHCPVTATVAFAH